MRAAAGGAAEAPRRPQGAGAAAGRAFADDWPSWLKAAGVARVTARGPEFQYYGQALQAAIDGLGIAMGIRPYIDDDLAAGRLVAPFALSVPKGMRWYLVYRGFRTEQRDFAAFRRWIVRAAANRPRAAGPPAGFNAMPADPPRLRGQEAGRKEKHRHVNEFTSVFGRHGFLDSQ